MSIRTRVLLVLLTLFSLYGAADFAIRQQMVWPSFQAWERHSADGIVARFEHRLQQELNFLNLLATDWAIWDESYRFARGTNPAYIDRHLPSGTLPQVEIDLFAIYDNRGQRLFFRSIQRLPGEIQEQLTPQNLTPIHRLLGFSNAVSLPERAAGGVLITTQGPWLVASRPILTNDGEGPVAGTLVMARELNAARVSRFAEEEAITLDYRWSASAAPVEGSGFATRGGDTRFIELSGQRLAAQRRLNAADGNASLTLTATLSRALTQQSYQQAQKAWMTTAGLGLAMLLLLAWLLNRTIVRPITDLSRVMQQVVERNDYSLRPRIKRRDELGHLSIALEELLQRIEGQNAAKQMHSRRLQKLADTDALTGIANRRALEDYLHLCWTRSRQQQHPMSVILCDIDHFKSFNDHYGHLQGDQCLQQVAEIMNRHIHRPGDTLFRYGGEEFAVLLPNTDLDGARQLAEKLRHALERACLIHDASPGGKVTLSLGVATAIGNDGPARMLLDAADRALYDSKDAGRNRVTSAAALSAPADRDHFRIESA
ncbi:sensor domain-containing diguanylate cyclase [Motiliproteus sediminis]|uniref:sensor domain-containing diguanylate cyclase n=1 Tax=Motiliproteus sediminis TaxID=1468178 RepID=UPI001AEFE3FD|nr:diguanylate cyclase [Motiliproteus sediminis]